MAKAKTKQVAPEKDIAKCRGFICIPAKKVEQRKVKKFLHDFKVDHVEYADAKQETLKYTGTHPDFNEITDDKKPRDYTKTVKLFRQ